MHRAKVEALLYLVKDFEVLIVDTLNIETISSVNCILEEAEEFRGDSKHNTSKLVILRTRGQLLW